MELFNINNLMKIIPTPSHQSYKMLLIDKIKRANLKSYWKAYFLWKIKQLIYKNLKKLMDSSQNIIKANLNIYKHLKKTC